MPRQLTTNAPVAPQAVAEAAATVEANETPAPADDEPTVTIAKPVKDANGIVIAWTVTQVPQSVYDAQVKVVSGGVVASPQHMIDEFVQEAAVKAQGFAQAPVNTGVHITPVVEAN